MLQERGGDGWEEGGGGVGEGGGDGYNLQHVLISVLNDNLSPLPLSPDKLLSKIHDFCFS